MGIPPSGDRWIAAGGPGGFINRETTSQQEIKVKGEELLGKGLGITKFNIKQKDINWWDIKILKNPKYDGVNDKCKLLLHFKGDIFTGEQNWPIGNDVDFIMINKHKYDEERVETYLTVFYKDKDGDIFDKVNARFVRLEGGMP